MMGPAPLMSAFDVTFQLVGSIVTIDLPSTNPMIEPACAVAPSDETASTPASASVFNDACMDMLPCDCAAESQDGIALATTAATRGVARGCTKAPAFRRAGNHKTVNATPASAPTSRAQGEIECARPEMM